jgi:hypothetical protein
MTTDEKRKLVEDVTKKLLGAIGKGTLDWLKEQGIGVTIFAFTFDAGAIAYISTAEREGMIRSLKEWIAYQEAGLTTEPRGERGRG